MSIKAMSWAWDQDCSGSQKLVLLALADHSDDDGNCWPGVRGLSNKCRLGDRTLRTSIAALELMGFLTSTPRYREDGSQTSNFYQLNMRGPSAEYAPPPETAFTPPPAKSASPPLQNQQGSESPLEPSVEPKDFSEDSNRNSSSSESATDKKPISEIPLGMTELEAVRGYPSGNYPAEASALKSMLAQGYTRSEVLECYQHLKTDHFWANKALALMTVKGQIGEWKSWVQKGRPERVPANQRPKTLQERRTEMERLAYAESGVREARNA